MIAREPDEIARQVDTGACESDRAFFRQHPRRSFRLRPAWAAEIEDFARHGVIQRELPNGLCWWILVHQLVPNKVRLRWPLAASHSACPDPPEKTVREVWMRHVPSECRKSTRSLQRDIVQVLARYPNESRS
jgi:hypothetical protein